MLKTTVPEFGEVPRVRGPFRLDSRNYQSVFDANRVLKGRYLVMWIKRGAEAGRRVGVVVSKRTFHDAVDRNRAKRLLRETFRLLRHHLPEDIELVMTARSGIAGKRCQDVMRDFTIVCKKGKLWREPSPPEERSGQEKI